MWRIDDLRRSEMKLGFLRQPNVHELEGTVHQ